MDNPKVFNEKLDPPVDIVGLETVNSIHCEDVGSAKANHVEHDVLDDLASDLSTENHVIASFDSTKLEGTGGNLNSTNDVHHGGFDQAIDISCLMGDDSIQCPSTSAGDLNSDNVLKDLDIYLDDLNACLTVSKMVNDSVIQGMVSAVIEEANKKIASKDMHILCLSEKLRHYELAESSSQIGSSMAEMEIEGAGQLTQSCSPDASIEQLPVECLPRLKIATVEQLQALRQCIEHLIHAPKIEVNSHISSGGEPFSSLLHERQKSCNLENFSKMASQQTFMEAVSEQVNTIFHLFEDTISEHKWTNSLQREFMVIVFKDSILRLKDEFERKLCEERKLLGNSFSAMFEEIRHFLQKELDLMSKTLFNSDLGHLSSHVNLDLLEERNMAKMKDNPFHVPPQSSKTGAESVDSPQLLHMSKEELINYYKTEMTKMRRHHESVLQEKTEELFAVKRELLREKASMPLRKDRDFEVLKRSMIEMISKLDNILMANGKFSIAEDDHETSPTNSGCACNTLWGDPCLRVSNSDKNDTLGYFSENDMNLISCPSQEAGLVQKIDKLELDVEDAKIEAELRGDVQGVLFRCWINETKNHIELMDMEVKAVHEVYSSMLTGSLEESKFIIDSMEIKHDEIKHLLESSIFQKEKTLHSEAETTMMLKQELLSLSNLTREKEDHIINVERTLLHQKEQLGEFILELSLLKDHKGKLEQLSSDNRDEIDSLKSELDKATVQAHEYEQRIAMLDENLCIALNGLKNTENEKKMLQNIIQQKENQLLAIHEREGIQREKMKLLVFSILKMSESFDGLETKMLEKINKSTAGVKLLKDQIAQLTEKAGVLQVDILGYKQTIEVKSANLQKAEAEVDLLGDEVDALLNLLAKIYIALEHYFPILQLYPGVMEVLNLIEREVKGVSRS